MTYLYTAKPTLVLKKLKSGYRVRADVEEQQLVETTQNSRILYDPDRGIIIEAEGTGLQEVEELFRLKKLLVSYEGENLIQPIIWSSTSSVPEITGETFS